MPIGASKISNFGLPDAIPDSVASRPEDNGTSDDVSDRRGAKINPNETFDAMGARISANTVGLTRAYAYDLTDDSLIAEKDISDLTSGDAFTLDAEFVSGTSYSIVADAEGAAYELGYFDDPNFPYVSEDVDYTGAINSATNDASNAQVIVEVGNVGFD